MKALQVHDLQAWYGDMQALFGVSLHVEPGETVALLGANGAGKSTLLRCIAGLVARKQGRIEFNGQDLMALPTRLIASGGLALVPEGRMLFASLNVEENLQMGAVTGRKGHWNLQKVYELMPVLQERRHQAAMTLSGGQQQMVAIGRGLMANPEVLLCDEVSLGLAPVVIEQIYTTFAQLKREGLAIVLVEQDVARARAASDRIYCMLKGRITLSGQSAAMGLTDISKAYFGN